MEEDNVAKRIQEKRKKIETHKRNSEDRAKEVKNIQASYHSTLSGAGEIVVRDIINKAKSFADYHTKIAKDGVGAKQTGYKLEDGTREVENYFLKSEERLSHLDKAAGIEELIDYIERQINSEAPIAPSADKK